MDSRVTAIIPTYNAGRFVRGAVRSVLSQRDVVVEVVVVDDGSTDDTWGILDEFGDAIRKHRVSHGGPYAARNYGASLATGEWLAFLDSDDEWLPDKVSAQLERVTFDTALVYTNCRHIGEIGEVNELESDNVQLYEGQVFRELLMGNFISLSSVMVRREWFQKLGGFATHERGVQDWDLWLRVAAAGGQVRLCMEPLTVYRHHSGQMSRKLRERLRDRVTVLTGALALPAASHLGWRVARQSMAKAWSISAFLAAEADPGQALQWHLKAASLWPFDGATYRQIAKCCLKSILTPEQFKALAFWSGLGGTRSNR